MVMMVMTVIMMLRTIKTIMIVVMIMAMKGSGRLRETRKVRCLHLPSRELCLAVLGAV